SRPCPRTSDFAPQDFTSFGSMRRPGYSTRARAISPLSNAEPSAPADFSAHLPSAHLLTEETCPLTALPKSFSTYLLRLRMKGFLLWSQPCFSQRTSKQLNKERKPHVSEPKKTEWQSRRGHRRVERDRRLHCQTSGAGRGGGGRQLLVEQGRCGSGRCG